MVVFHYSTINLLFKKNGSIKKLFFGFLLMALCSISQAQEIPIGTNTIVVEHVSLDQAVNALLKSGYTLDTIDKKSQSCVTKFKDVPKTICHISISLYTKDGKAIISGKMWSNINPPGKDCFAASHCIYPVTFMGMGPRNIDAIFHQMDDYAKSLKSKIIYEKR